MRKNFPFQLDLLKNSIENLCQVEMLIHVLCKADVSTLEPCEIEDSLSGINALLGNRINELRERVALIEGVKHG